MLADDRTPREAFERLLRPVRRRRSLVVVGRPLALPRHRTTSDWHLRQLSPREQAKHSARVEDFSGFQIDETAAVVGRHKIFDRRFLRSPISSSTPFLHLRRRAAFFGLSRRSWLRGCKALTRSSSPFRRCAVQPPPSARGPPSEGRDCGGRKSMEENMRVPIPPAWVGRFDVFPLTSEARSAADRSAADPTNPRLSQS